MRVCPRCQTPVQAGGKVGARAAAGGPAHALRYNPAGLPTPSPIQGHATTVLVGIVAAVVLLAFGAWFVLRGVGPFRAEVVRQTVSADGAAVEVELRVVNEGERQGGPAAGSPGWARTGGSGPRG